MPLALRNLLVVLAGLSTVLAGLRGAEAAAPDWRPAFVAFDPEPLDGSREDDSGKPSDEAEEDDRETKSGREIHLLATTVLARALEARGVFFDAGSRAAKPRQQGRAAWIRGPPAAR